MDDDVVNRPMNLFVSLEANYPLRRIWRYDRPSRSLDKNETFVQLLTYHSLCSWFQISSSQSFIDAHDIEIVLEKSDIKQLNRDQETAEDVGLNIFDIIYLMNLYF